MRRDRDRLGPDFGKLWAASSVSTLGDGITITAGPLLASTLTRDPLAIGLVSAVSFLPWLLVGLVSGALADRLDKRLLMWAVDLARAAVLAALAVATLGGWITLPLLALGLFLLGVGQTLFDSAAQSAIPAVVSRDRDRLERANGRLESARTVSQQFAGAPAGGVLFSAATWLPFAADAVSFVASSALLARMRGRFAPERGQARRSLRADIAEGVRWLAGHRLLRALTLMVAASNLAFSAGDAVLVLLAQDRLGLGAIGFGLLVTGAAVGATLGSASASTVSRRLGTARTILATSWVGVGGTLLLGVSTHAVMAAAALAVTGFGVALFNVLYASLRQAATPARLLGRVVSAGRLVGWGAVPVGALLGGLLARVELRLPYLAGGAALALATVLVTRIVTEPAISAARAAATATVQGADQDRSTSGE